MSWLKSVSLFLSLLSAKFAVGNNSIDFCLETDSISCLQLEMYKIAKSGFTTIHNNFIINTNLSREKKSYLPTIITENEKKIIKSEKVLSRQEALEDYFTEELKHFWSQRGSVVWNPRQTIESLIRFIPSFAKAKIGKLFSERKFNEEGRSDKNKPNKKSTKKSNKYLLPLLIGLKLKLSTLISIAYVTIAVIAKKAILVGIVSMLLSGFVMVKKLLMSERGKTEFTTVHPMEWQPAYWQYEEPEAAETRMKNTENQMAYSSNIQNA